MQLVCETCGAVGPAAKVEVVEGAVRLTCGTCGAVASLGTGAVGAASTPAISGGLDTSAARLAAASEAVSPGTTFAPADLLQVPLEPLDLGEARSARGFADAGVSLPPIKCPKCGHRQHDEDACHRCGLVFARVADGRRPWEADYTEAQRQRLPEAARQFDRVEERPQEAARHEAFVQWCRDSDMMFFAAQRYAHLAADRPHDPITTRYRQQVTHDLHAATMALVRADVPSSDGSKKVRAVLLGVVVVACLAALMLLARMMRGAPTGLP